MEWRSIRGAAGVVGVLALLAIGAGYWHVEAPYPLENERFGVGLAASASRIVDYDLEGLGASWYLNWSTSLEPPHPNGAAFMQTIRLQRGVPQVSGDQLRELVRANPGATWQIGNEPDSIWLDNTEPEAYASAYFDLYHLIKRQDPSARVANGGLVQATPLRMAYLERVWETYQERFGGPMPVDVWIVHGFILREQRGRWGAEIPPGMGDAAHLGRLYTLGDHDDLGIFAEQIERFRRWMADHGQQDKPLMVNEYGILMPTDILDEEGEDFSDDRVIAFMEGTFDYFLGATDSNTGYPADGDRLVQAWAWYSLDDDRYDDGHTVGHGYNGDLFTGAHEKTMTPLGEAYADYVHQEVGIGEHYVDLAPLALAIDAIPGARAGGPYTVTISAEVVNHGQLPASNVAIELWNGSPQAGGTRLASQVVGEIPGRYQGTYHFEFVWAPVPVGWYQLALVVDPPDAVAEADEANNVVENSLLLPSSFCYFPSQLRAR